jgi:predicted kinase
MLVGVPGSGKSTWIEKRGYGDEGQGRDITVLSTDYFIEVVAKQKSLTYDDVFKDTIKNAERKLWDDLKYATDRDDNIIWDQTNLTRKSRAKKLIMIPDHYEKIAVIFQTPHREELISRLAHRSLNEGKTIPQNVIDNMIDTLEYPELSEGFDRVIYMDQSEEVNV